MSRQTNLEKEPSVSCGFYDSLNGDRRYYASQMSRIFDGIIKDGIFASIGTCLVVTEGSENTVIVGEGKCWFDHTFTENDAPLPIDCGNSHPSLDRIDAIVVRTDSSESMRDNFIEFVQGTAASNPVKPTMTHTKYENWYPLCYITRKAGSTSIRQADIENAVGFETPFVTAILETLDPDQLLLQWQDELDRFVKQEEDKMSVFAEQFGIWVADQQASILAWHKDLKYEMSGDVALNLQFQIDKEEVERILISGFVDGVKTLSEDGSVITSVDSKGRKLVKKFSEDFLTTTTEFTDEYGGYIAKMIKTISKDGKEINTEILSSNIES